MRKGLASATLVLSAALALSACTNQGDLGNKNIRPNNFGHKMRSLGDNRFANDQANEMNRVRGTQRLNNNVVGLHGNTKMEVSQEISRKLAALPEIKSAYVLLTDRNAYVAITEEPNGTKQSTKTNVRSHYRSNRVNGLGAPLADRGIGSGNPFSITPRAAAPGRSGYDGVGSQTGTAYGGTSVEVSERLKNKVADLVKGMSPSTENVYVSANPDFYERMARLAADFRQGHPIQGMINEFNALVERIFPEPAGTGTTDRARMAPTYTRR